MIYFDHNATTPLIEKARDAWLAASKEHWANPSSPHRQGAQVRTRLESERETIADLFGIDADELLFCSSATEAINAWVRNYYGQKNPRPLLVSKQEHAAVMESVEAYSNGNVIYYSPNTDDLAANLKQLIDREKPGGLMLMAANNETGEIYPWRDVGELCEQAGIPYFCDMSQWLGKMPLEGLSKLSFFCGSSHKLSGPKGIGFLKISRRFHEIKLSYGGNQEKGQRAGTEDYPGISATASALLGCAKVDEEFSKQRQSFKHEWLKKLKSKMPDVIIHTTKQSLWNTVSVALPEKDGNYWLSKLEKLGFTVGLGAACSTGKSGVSHVLNDLGVEDAIIRRTIRISASVDTNETDWWKLLDALVSIRDEILNESSTHSKVEVIRI